MVVDAFSDSDKQQKKRYSGAEINSQNLINFYEHFQERYSEGDLFLADRR